LRDASRHSGMSEQGPDAGDGGPDEGRGWKVDEDESLARLRRKAEEAGGALVYIDENGQRRRLPADLDELSPEQRRAAVAALSSALGAPDPGYARLAAVERLTELRAAGRLSEENYQRERRRLLGGG